MECYPIFPVWILKISSKMPESVPEIAVVILNWNGKNFLEKFLPFVYRNASGASIVVADNASTDDSVHFLESRYPDVRIIRNEENGGFARGYNRALQHVKARYYLLLNSDVEVTAGWLAPLLQIMNADDTIGACQPKVKDYNNRKLFEYAGAAGGFIDCYGYPLCRGRIINTIEEDRGQYDDNSEIFWASGAAMMIRAELFHKLGGFDEDFFAHMEEIDLCWRMKNAGYKIMYCGASTVYHVGGGTLHKSNPRKTYLNFKNNLSLLHKNLSQKRLFFVLFARLMMDGLAAVTYILKMEWGNFAAVLKAHYAYYTHLKVLNAKRYSGIKNSHYGILKSSIIFNYFFLFRRKFSHLKQT